MNVDSMNLQAALPEILLLAATCAVLLFEAVVKSASRPSSRTLALVALLFPAAALLGQAGSQETFYAFSGMYVADPLATLLKLCALIATAVALIYADRYTAEREMSRSEFHLLALFSLLGTLVMISAGNLLTVYLGLELMSLSLYALAALRRDDAQATEAAIKYFVLGALSSGFLLYGMSMIYGGAGSLDIALISERFDSGMVNPMVFSFGVVFLVAGIAFKIGAVPFHMWLPDVYHGTPTSVTLLIAAAPKLGSFAIAFRLLVEALPGVAADWQPMMLVLAVASLAVGNVVAIAQTNFKRMLAWSAIAQVGFVLLGFLAGIVDGDPSNLPSAWGASLFYVIAYVLTTLGTFGLIQLMARKGFEADRIADLRGLNARNPGMALVMLIMMFSLTGIPPFIGFYAKLMVLAAVVDAGLVWLAVLAVVFSVIGAFYYLRIVKSMYFDEPVELQPVEASAGARATLAVNGAAVLLLGIVPGPLMMLCLQAVQTALAG
jgi:NADH-quinone oxidoreductase subunit N